MGDSNSKVSLVVVVMLENRKISKLQTSLAKKFGSEQKCEAAQNQAGDFPTELVKVAEKRPSSSHIL